MKKLLEIIAIIALVAIVLILAPTKTIDQEFTTGAVIETITIATFNIQIFGVSKSSKTDIMTILADLVSLYDIVAIQEIRDKSGVTMPRFMEYLDGFDYIIGPRLGRSNSKEQYAYLYNPLTIEFLGEETYNDINDVYEREPMMAHFKAKNGNFDFVLANIHVKPSDAANEIEYLPNITSSLDKDVIFLGDFNADGSYYKEEKLQDIFTDYIIIITNDIDTTVAKSDNTYDRIIGYKTIEEDYAGTFGVEMFEDKAISDHYLVWAEFYINGDTD